jgi:hypothetical protein
VIGWKPKFNDITVASVRYRCLNPLKELQRSRFQIELFSEKNLDRYSAVIFSKLYDDRNYNLALKLKRNGKAVVFDVCDNHFYNPYGLEEFRVVRQQLLRMISVADLITVSTEALADVLMEEGKLEVRPTVIGDAIEQEILEPKPIGWLRRLGGRVNPGRSLDDKKANLLWFGIHGGENAPYGILDVLNQKDLLADLAKRYPLRLTVVSNSREKFLKYIEPLPFETCYREWNIARFGETLRASDICIIPITKNPFTNCKTNNRLASALYAGIPTIADCIPSYRDLSSFCIFDDWEYGLRKYLSDKVAAQEHAKPAKEFINSRYTMRQIGTLWAKHLGQFLA